MKPKKSKRYRTALQDDVHEMAQELAKLASDLEEISKGAFDQNRLQRTISKREGGARSMLRQVRSASFILWILELDCLRAAANEIARAPSAGLGPRA
jgi:predicted RNase H-like nuclease (RuvC/YqgF family)